MIFFRIAMVSSKNHGHKSCVTWMSSNQDFGWDFYLVYWLIHSGDETIQKSLCLLACGTVDRSVHTYLYCNCANFWLFQLLYLLSKVEESKGLLHTWVFGETAHVGTYFRTWIYFLLASTFTSWYCELNIDLPTLTEWPPGADTKIL